MLRLCLLGQHPQPLQLPRVDAHRGRTRGGGLGTAKVVALLLQASYLQAQASNRLLLLLADAVAYQAHLALWRHLGDVAELRTRHKLLRAQLAGIKKLQVRLGRRLRWALPGGPVLRWSLPGRLRILAAVKAVLRAGGGQRQPLHAARVKRVPADVRREKIRTIRCRNVATACRQRLRQLPDCSGVHLTPKSHTTSKGE
ncbi:hypothetical protein B484DRAFT_455017 [Ochromonadaceae sp. CCMP2298]|nr:hypothetical protein B484DRAFT_455017 [Ochromonadaceae sp. CCMP2298]